MKPNELFYLNNVKCIIFPFVNNGNSYTSKIDTYTDFLKNKNYIKLQYNNINDTYFMSKSDEHHFTTKYHYNYVMPLLAEQFKFNYNKNDFNLIDYKITSNNIVADYSYFIPKVKTEYEITTLKYYHKDGIDIVGYIDKFNMSYNEFIFRDTIYNWDFYNDLSPDNPLISTYRRMYYFPHQVSKLHNCNCHNGRTLLILGDSQILPSIMPLSYYFENLIYIDNREYLPAGQPFENEKITDILYTFWEGTGFSKYKLNFYGM